MPHSQMKIIEAVYRQNYKLLMFKALKHGLSPGDAEDLIMDVFQGTIKNFEGIEKKTEKGVRNYIISGLMNRLKNYYRKNRLLIIPEASMDDVDSESMSQLEMMEAVEQRRLIAKLLDRIPEKYRDVLWLDLFKGATTEEIKETLGISESSIKVRRHRGKKHLRKLLEREQGRMMIPVLVGMCIPAGYLTYLLCQACLQADIIDRIFREI